MFSKKPTSFLALNEKNESSIIPSNFMIKIGMCELSHAFRLVRRLSGYGHLLQAW